MALLYVSLADAGVTKLTWATRGPGDSTRSARQLYDRGLAIIYAIGYKELV